MLRRLLSVLPLMLAASCVALVEEPSLLVPCDTANGDSCPEGFECGYFAAPIQSDGAEVNACVPEDCKQGASCKPGCLCACEGCAEDELCDVTHSESDARANGEACVPAACFDQAGQFVCGSVDVGGTDVPCLPCPG